jgi:hypothetical protein
MVEILDSQGPVCDLRRGRPRYSLKTVPDLLREGCRYLALPTDRSELAQDGCLDVTNRRLVGVPGEVRQELLTYV